MSQDEGLSALDPGTGASGMVGDRLSRPTKAPGAWGDSDLEAFSHNPTVGSLAPLAPEPSIF